MVLDGRRLAIDGKRSIVGKAFFTGKERGGDLTFVVPNPCNYHLKTYPWRQTPLRPMHPKQQQKHNCHHRR